MWTVATIGWWARWPLFFVSCLVPCALRLAQVEADDCFGQVGAGIQMGNTAVCSYVVDAYPMQSMATMTFYAVMLNLSAFADPFFIVPWVENAGFTWLCAGHAIITVFFCVPLLVAVHKFGAAMREKSGSPTWVNPEFEQTAAAS